jgi:hypothetical protein
MRGEAIFFNIDSITECGPQICGPSVHLQSPLPGKFLRGVR